MHMKQVFFAHDGVQDPAAGQFSYCPFCGSPLSIQEHGGRPRPACPNCRFVQYRNPLPGVVIVIEQAGRVLLGKRTGSYGEGQWGLPQGFIEADEDFLTAALREVKEETGLDVAIESIINIVSNFLTPRLQTLAIVLLARAVAGEPRAADDLTALQWFSLNEPLPDLAFEADRWILNSYQQTQFQLSLPVDPVFAQPGDPGA